jgi:hypothetical protein
VDRRSSMKLPPLRLLPLAPLPPTPGDPLILPVLLLLLLLLLLLFRRRARVCEREFLTLAKRGEEKENRKNY